MTTTIEFRETEETIQLIVHPAKGEPQTFFLDADDLSWELTLDDNGTPTELRIA
jgi:hypothetical protein